MKNPTTKIRSLLLTALFAGLAAASTAWAVGAWPTSPGDYVYFYDESGEVIGQAWIACYSSELQQWGETSSIATKTHMFCPPPRD